MKTYIFALIFSIFFIKMQAQNIGINQPIPAERLDVNGNINVTGTIKANGMAGQAGQTLTHNAAGDLVWQDLIGTFKNFENIRVAGSSTWTVPAGVTKILVEGVGGGSGGTIEGGGGGGGYFMALLDVTPSTTLSYSVGAGGSGSAGAASTAGGPSSITYGTINLQAQGGLASSFASGTFTSNGGVVFYTGPSTYRSFMTRNGAAGSVSHTSFQQRSSTAFYEIYEGGYGGGPGYCRECTSRGSYVIYDIAGASTYRRQSQDNRIIPGAGGGAGVALISVGGFTGGGTGADGQIIIHF